MNTFLTKEYVKTKTLEETFQLVDKLKAFENQLENLNEQMVKTEGEKASVEREIAGTQQKMAELKTKGAVSQLNRTDVEINSLSMEVKHALHHLEKPFIKLQALSLHGGGSGLTQEEVKKLGQYLENPFETLATEETNYPLLRQILQKTERLMADAKLKLKPDKMRKAEQAIDNILNKNALTSLQQKCADAVTQKTRLSQSDEVKETKNDLSKLQGLIEKLEIRKISIESEENTVKQAYNETLGKIQHHKSQIEKNILNFMDKQVKIE
jgi:anion-transporting  ArsA/GET3 family ATPase